MSDRIVRSSHIRFFLILYIQLFPITAPMSEFKTLEDYLPTTEIYVLDTETTGLKGAPVDLVVDIGIVKVDLKKGSVIKVYDSVVGYDITEWDDYLSNAWIFTHTDMTLEMVADAPPAVKVIDDVRHILRGKNVTSYNIQYDMGKFLYKEPWNLRGTFNECKDIMLAAKDVCKLPSMYIGGDYRYPKLDYAYETIVEGDPAGIHGNQDHRAYSDAIVASYVMIQMYRDGTYVP